MSAKAKRTERKSNHGQDAGEKQMKRVDRVYGIPLLFVLAVVPLLTMMGTYRSGIGKYLWASGTAFFDFFLVYKSRSLMMAGILILILICVLLYSGNRGHWTRDQQVGLVLVSLFFLMAVISTLAAAERSEALFGGYEQMEGLFVVVAYIACFMFACLFVSDVDWVQVLLRTLLASSLVLSLLGALQAFGIDYLTSDSTFSFFTMFMRQLPENFAGISASFGEGVSYATLYNPNYVGTYVALVLPVTVLLGLWEKKVLFRVMAVVSSVLQLVMLAGAQSMTGLIGVASGALLAVVFLFADGKKNRRVLIGVLGGGMVMTAGVLFLNPGILNRFTSSTISKCSERISSMVSTDHALRIDLDSGKQIWLKWKPSEEIYNFTVTDEEGRELTLTGDTFQGVKIQGEAYRDIVMASTKTQLEIGDQTDYYDVLRLTAEEAYSWDFVKVDGRLRYVNRVGKLDQLHEVEAMGFKGHYDLATNRGYIWSRTLPLLKETWLLGVGPDNFVYAFPNDDYVGKVNCGFDGQIVTKPHNMYMQIWVQYGMPACLALAALYLLFAFNTFRRCFRKGTLTYIEKVNIALLCGVTGYMAAGLANDSTICVAPVFWILLGLGYSMGRVRHHNSQ